MCLNLSDIQGTKAYYTTVADEQIIKIAGNITM